MDNVNAAASSQAPPERVATEGAVQNAADEQAPHRDEHGGAEDAPNELIPSMRLRRTEEPWPCQVKAVAYDRAARRYIYSFSGGEDIPELSTEEFPRMRTDYRLGVHDPMQYPQLWQPTAPHMAWIAHVPRHRDLYRQNIVGYVIQRQDWKAIEEGAMYGRLQGPLLARLQDAFFGIHAVVLPLMREARTRLLLPTATINNCIRLLSDLHTLTATFRETAKLVTQVQRGIAELRAFYLFRLDVRHHVGNEHFVSKYMFDCVGVFTTDRSMADLLHRLGMPVWLVSKSMPHGMKKEALRPPREHWRFVEMKPLDSLDADGRDWLGRQYSESTTPPLYDSDDGRAVTPQPEGVDAPSSDARAGRRGTTAPPPARSSRARSKSPSRRAAVARPRSPARGSFWLAPTIDMSGTTYDVPQYVLREEARLNEKSRSHRPPEAPPAWCPRTWATDPGQQANQRDDLPAWVPQVPAWLEHVARSVDRSLSREFRLCAPDTVHPVPQERFKQMLQYTLPPFHMLLAKNQGRMRYLFRSWAALRDFWLRRILREGFCGLAAGTWRKVLDDKYNMDGALKAWIDINSKNVRAMAMDVDAGDNTSSMDITGDNTTPSAPEAGGMGSEVNAARTSSAASMATHSNLAVPSLPASTRYTRVPEAGEDLLIHALRTNVEPEGWMDWAVHGQMFYEREQFSMYLVDDADRERVVASQGEWHEFWDYENRRILLFKKSSHLLSEPGVMPDVEILLNEACLKWHSSIADADGLAQASRAMWMATVSLHKTANKAASSSVAAQPSPPARASADAPAHDKRPAPDPVYGYHPEVPNGHHIKSFVIRQQELPLERLDQPEVRAFLIWELQETAFRFQLRDLDVYILKSLKLWTPSVQKTRETLWVNCWGGEDGFVPLGLHCPLHTDPDPKKRAASIYSLWKVVRSWPRCREVPNLRQYTAAQGLSVETLLVIEREVWSFYAQSYYDYFGILPAIPTCMPVNPFLS